MMKMTMGVLALVFWTACQEAPTDVAPDAWIIDGDADGDGLKDEFEVRHGLDPNKAESFADGLPDEDRLAPSGKTMWELQNEETRVASAGSGGACGATGIEALAFAALAIFFRRRT